MKRSLCLMLAALLVFAIACGGGSDDKPASTPASSPTVAATSQAVGRSELAFVTKSGKKAVIYAEIAQTIPELNIGLSKRSSLPSDVGMLFVLPFKGPGFWMKDTTIPLSIAFIAPCGDILGLADMQPLTEELHTVDADYPFALEVNQGWFAKNGVGVGDKLSLPTRLKLPGCP